MGYNGAIGSVALVSIGGATKPGSTSPTIDVNTSITAVSAATIMARFT